MKQINKKLFLILLLPSVFRVECSVRTIGIKRKIKETAAPQKRMRSETAAAPKRMRSETAAAPEMMDVEAAAPEMMDVEAAAPEMMDVEEAAPKRMNVKTAVKKINSITKFHPRPSSPTSVFASNASGDNLPKIKFDDAYLKNLKTNMDNQTEEDSEDDGYTSEDALKVIKLTAEKLNVNSTRENFEKALETTFYQAEEVSMDIWTAIKEFLDKLFNKIIYFKDFGIVGYKVKQAFKLEVKNQPLNKDYQDSLIKDVEQFINQLTKNRNTRNKEKSEKLVKWLNENKNKKTKKSQLLISMHKEKQIMHKEKQMKKDPKEIIKQRMKDNMASQKKTAAATKITTD